MVRTQIQLSEEQAAALKKLAAEKHVSMAELIRRCVDRFIRLEGGVGDAERRRRAMAAVGLVNSGLSDLATEHDRYLAEAYATHEQS
jgi:hypothetical protein